MNNNTLKMSLRTLIVLLVLTLVAQGVAAQDAATTDDDSNDINGDIGMIGVGLALGLAAIGAGFSKLLLVALLSVCLLKMEASSVLRLSLQRCQNLS